MRAENLESLIELRVENVAQLFHTLDPFPFRERDLDREAEEFIVGWAQELPVQLPIRILVHLPRVEWQLKRAEEISEGFAKYFSDRAVATQRELNELFRMGRRSLAIGLSILLVCFAALFVLHSTFEATWLRFVEESLLILGWVANWRPLEIFLYDWLPLVRRRDLYGRLSKAAVEVEPDATENLLGS